MTELEWVRNLRIDITDETAADGITPDGLLAYLTANGWMKRSDYPRRNGELWRHPDLPPTHPSFVPLDEGNDDYQRCVLQLARNAAIPAGASTLAVLLDLRAASRIAALDPATAKPVTVTVTDPETGDSETAELIDDYAIVTAGTCRYHVDAQVGGKHVITITGRKGRT